MTIYKEIDPKLGRTNQVGLRLHCESAEAEAIHRALRLTFLGKVSQLLPSFHPNFSFCIYVTASAHELEAKWREIEQLAGVAASSDSAGVSRPSSPARTATQPAPRSPKPAAASPVNRSSAATDFKAWERQFRAAVKILKDDTLILVSTGASLSTAWVLQELEAGRPSEELEEQLLQQSALSPQNVLRAQIALYDRLNKPEKIVALCEQQYNAVLALPPSSLLVEQLIRAYTQIAQRDQDQRLLNTGQRLAQSFLPELERLQQAEKVRTLLRDKRLASDEPATASLTLNEQLDQIIQIEPAERLTRLNELVQRHPQVWSLQLALADTYAALGDRERAIALYQSIPQQSEAYRQASHRLGQLWLDTQRYQEVLERISATETDRTLQGLRGAALYWTGQPKQALELLQVCWQEGELQRAILLPLARAWVANRQDEQALEPYQLLLEIAPDQLEAQDYAQIAISTYASLDVYGVRSQLATLCERYLTLNGPQRCPGETTDTMLEIRMEVAVDETALRTTSADRLEWLIQQGDHPKVEKCIDTLREQTNQQRLKREDFFALLEGIEVYSDAWPYLSDMLASEYQIMAIQEIDVSLRHNRPFPVYMHDLRRALHFLNRSLADELNTYIESERQELIKRNQPVPEEAVDSAQQISLASQRVALVGGHHATRREVIKTLEEEYGLSEYVEIGPSSEEHIDSNSVRERIANCNLIAVITGYMGHDLSTIVRDLKQSGALTGEVIWLHCRGKSGVVREITKAANLIN